MDSKKIMMVLSMFLIIGSSYLLFGNYNNFTTGQGGITGMPIATASVEVTAISQISMPVNSVSFGATEPGATKDTSKDSPPPFKIQNDGTVSVNVTIARDSSSAPLFSGTGGGDNTASFQFAANETVAEPGSFDTTTSLMSWTNVPGTTPITFLKILDFATSGDEAEVELRISVPIDEPAGVKSEALMFIASQA
ncbi:MAG: hypothetical protein KJ697_03475 [Nanoarchaeota archaeon]|nr:hypothetical protein [Nanoarchaeota archaeon]MBU4124166.1 hypothetical protein [Nanoarchaeota archaeon]